jgi:hypothetical protein
MEKLLDLLENISARAIASSSIGERRRHFKSAIIKLYKELYPQRTMEEFDRFNFGDITYLRVYDLMVASKRMTGATAANAAAEDEVEI